MLQQENNNNCIDEIKSKINELIIRGNSILESTEHENVSQIPGIHKFRRKVKKEILFLNKVLLSKNPVKAYVQCSNLQQLEALINQVYKEKECISILASFKYSDAVNVKKLIVDVVSCNGNRWNKIIARNARALTLNSCDDKSFGLRSIIDQANDYIECANEHPYLFKIPEIVFHFTSGIEFSLANDLRNLGIKINGQILDNVSGSELKNEINACSLFTEKTVLKILNLDVCTMMAYISSCTNGGCNAEIDSVILSEQLHREKIHSVKHFLDDLFKGKQLVCCKTAEDNFQSIVHTVGGPKEKERASQFLKRIIVVPDNPSEKSLILKIKGKIKNRSIVIFGTGDRLKIPTVTANTGFIRAAKHQGVEFVAYVHEPRSLTEAKEKKFFYC